MACLLLLLLRAAVALSKWDGGVNQLNAKWTQVQSNTTDTTQCEGKCA
jgi:hypothetical protein